MTDVLDAAKHSTLSGGASFPLANRLTRLVWGVVWGALASWTPPNLFGWRRFLLRLFGAKIAPEARIYGNVRIWLPSNLEVGNHAGIAPGVNVYCMGRITIHDRALISQGAHLCAGTHNIDDAHFQLVTRPIVIHAHAWVAAEAFVGPGVTIGEGAVLGARGVAMRSLEPWTVYSGNPAKPIRQRRLNHSGVVDG